MHDRRHAAHEGAIGRPVIRDDEVVARLEDRVAVGGRHDLDRPEPRLAEEQAEPALDGDRGRDGRGARVVEDLEVANEGIVGRHEDLARDAQPAEQLRAERELAAVGRRGAVGHRGLREEPEEALVVHQQSEAPGEGVRRPALDLPAGPDVPAEAVRVEQRDRQAHEGCHAARVGRRGVVEQHLLGVGPAVAVGVRNEWVGLVDQHLLAVREPVTVRIGEEQVGAVLDLGAVREPVPVEVTERVRGVERVEAVVPLDPVRDAVAIRVGVERVGAVLELVAVVEAVVIGVWVEGIGVGQAHLYPVTESVAVGVEAGRVGVEGEHLLAVAEPVAIRVLHEGVGAERLLAQVVEAVAVGVRPGARVVRVERIEVVQHLEAVVQEVAVRVRIRRVRAEGELVGVGEPVAVRVLLSPLLVVGRIDR